MSLSETVRENFNTYRVCVIIPTYNNAATLQKVIEEVSIYTNNIIVVNDGSSDDSLTIIKKFPTIHLVSYPDNVGKGWALRQGFAAAINLNYQYAISIDSDGQHFAYDLPAFINQLILEQHTVIIGARNMNQSTVPGGSSFGNRVSNFWFRVETGINAPDTQSGYRLYPLEPIKHQRERARRFRSAERDAHCGQLAEPLRRARGVLARPAALRACEVDAQDCLARQHREALRRGGVCERAHNLARRHRVLASGHAPSLHRRWRRLAR